MAQHIGKSRSTSAQRSYPEHGLRYTSKDKEGLQRLSLLLNKLGLSPNDAIDAVVSRVGPPGVSGMLSNWKKLKHFNHTAPPTRVVEEVFKRAGFMCEKCGTQLRLSIDHKDRDATNHAGWNLALKCMPCNQGYTHKKTTLTFAVLELFDELGIFPSNAQILERAGLTAIGSYAFYINSYLRTKLEAEARTKKIPRLVAEFKRLEKRRSKADLERMVDILVEAIIEAQKVSGEGAFKLAYDRPRPLVEYVARLADLALGKKVLVDVQN